MLTSSAVNPGVHQVLHHAHMRTHATAWKMLEGYTKVVVRTVDTDVLVLAVTAAQCLDITELWATFGTGKSFRYLAAHEMAKALGPDCCTALPMFHAFTGCDTVSSFLVEARRVHGIMDDVTTAFYALAATPGTVPSKIGWKFWSDLWYCCTSSQESVNQGCKQLFTQKGRAIDGLPPTQAALIQHTKRASYQAGHY